MPLSINSKIFHAVVDLTQVVFANRELKRTLKALFGYIGFIRNRE
jgi:hypothetical protein